MINENSRENRYNTIMQTYNSEFKRLEKVLGVDRHTMEFFIEPKDSGAINYSIYEMYFACRRLVTNNIKTQNSTELDNIGAYVEDMTGQELVNVYINDNSKIARPGVSEIDPKTVLLDIHKAFKLGMFHSYKFNINTDPSIKENQCILHGNGRVRIKAELPEL